MNTLRTNINTMETMSLIKKILDNHDYSYSSIYQRFTRGMIRVQYDFKKDLKDLSGYECGMLIATKMLLNNYGIIAAVEIKDAKGNVKILFRNDFDEIRRRNDLVV